MDDDAWETLDGPRTTVRRDSTLQGCRAISDVLYMRLQTHPPFKPDSLRLTTVRGERIVRRLERRKEQGIIWMSHSLHVNIPSPVPSKRPCHIRKTFRHLKVYEDAVTRCDKRVMP